MSSFRRRLMQSLNGILTKISGKLPLLLKNAKNKKLKNYTIYGNCTQETTPTIDTPVEVKETGDLTNNILVNNLVPGATGTIAGVNYTVNKDLSIYLKGKTTGTFSLRLAGKWNNPNTILIFRAGKTYTLAGKTGNFYTSLYKTAVDGSTSQYTNTLTANPRIITPAEDINIGDIFIYCAASSVGTEIDDTIYPLCIEGSYSEVHEYEPYGKYKIPVKITCGDNEKKTNIYLESPIIKIGEVSDYLDFKDQKIYRKNYKSTISSNGNYVVSSISSSPNRLVIYNALNAYKKAKGSLEQLCKYMPCVNWAANGKFGFYASGRIVYINNPNFTTVEEYKAWLDSLEDLVFYYQLANDCVYEEDIIVPEITLFDGSCEFDIITDTKPSKAEVEYWR
jgi:hypothetical protein